MRPEFQYRNLQQRINPVTQHYEPYLPPIEKFIRLFGSGITVLFFVCSYFYKLFKNVKFSYVWLLHL